MRMNKVFTRGEVLKAVPSGLFKAKCDLYGFASVEVPDREGDVIRVKGINIPEGHPVKVAPAHKYSNPLEVLGTVEEWVVTTKSVKGKAVPALAFGMNWAKGEGEAITPFASQYKGLYDSGALDAFSGGFAPNPEKVQTLKGGRYDIGECELFELSACMIGVNPYATRMKAIVDALGTDGEHAYLGEQIDELQKSIDRACGLNESLLKAFTERFDTFESKYVAQADDEPLPRDRRTAQPEDTEALKSLKALIARL
jgi:hypothetical protein